MCKKVFLLSAAFIFITFFTTLVSATDYYVAPSNMNGNDANNGLSTQSPWLTLSHAITASSGGDTIYVRAGTYTGAGYQDLSPKSGSASSYTTIQGYPGDAMPVIDANGPGGSKFTVFTLNNSYIKVSGLHLKGGGGVEVGTVTIGNSGVASNIIVENCIVSDTNVGGTHTTYNPAHIRIGYDGTANGVLVQNCEIYGGDASGFKIDGRKAQNITIKNNHIHNTLQGIAVKWGYSYDQNILLEYNKIHDTSERGFYIDQGYVVIDHNLVYNASGGGLVANDNFNGNNLIITYNTFYNASVELRASTATNGVIKNNIIANSGSNSISLFPYSSISHGTDLDYNLVYDAGTSAVYREDNTNYTYSAWKSHYPSDAHSIQADPMFENPSTGDFRLRANSPAIGSGSDGINMGTDPCKTILDSCLLPKPPALF